jgi:hypothetical protein
MPEDGDSAAVLEVDFPGAVLLVASLMIAVFAIVQTGQYGGVRAHDRLWRSGRRADACLRRAPGNRTHLARAAAHLYAGAVHPGGVCIPDALAPTLSNGLQVGCLACSPRQAHPGGGEREFQRAESPSEVLVVTGMLTRLPERPITSPMRSGRPSPAGWPTLFPGNTLRVIPRRPESGWEAKGDICYGLARNLTLPQLSGRMSGRGTLVSYLQFSAAADGPVWGNGLCRSQAWTPSIWK